MKRIKFNYMKDLTNSNIERQNILNNQYVLQMVQEYIGLPGMLFDEEYKFTSKGGLKLIASFEAGIAFEIEKKYKELNRKLFSSETESSTTSKLLPMLLTLTLYMIWKCGFPYTK